MMQLPALHFGAIQRLPLAPGRADQAVQKDCQVDGVHASIEGDCLVIDTGDQSKGDDTTAQAIQTALSKLFGQTGAVDKVYLNSRDNRGEGLNPDDPRLKGA